LRIEPKDGNFILTGLYKLAYIIEIAEATLTWIVVWISRTTVALSGVRVTDLVGRSDTRISAVDTERDIFTIAYS
jgi:hypothetical protein